MIIKFILSCHNENYDFRAALFYFSHKDVFVFFIHHYMLSVYIYILRLPFENDFYTSIQAVYQNDVPK